MFNVGSNPSNKSEKNMFFCALVFDRFPQNGALTFVKRLWIYSYKKGAI